MLIEGDAAVPAKGMGAIPEQLAARLSADALRLNTPVDCVEPGRVVLRSGEELCTKSIVVATDGPAASQVLGSRLTEPASRAVCCLYFAANESPLKEPILALNADEPGPVNHFAVLSDVAPSYAPSGRKLLISASVLGNPTADDASLTESVRGTTGRAGLDTGGAALATFADVPLSPRPAGPDRLRLWTNRSGRPGSAMACTSAATTAIRRRSTGSAGVRLAGGAQAVAEDLHSVAG